MITHLAEELDVEGLGIGVRLFRGRPSGNPVSRGADVGAVAQRLSGRGGLGCGHIRRRGGIRDIRALILLWYYGFACFGLGGGRGDRVFLGNRSTLRSRCGGDYRRCIVDHRRWLGAEGGRRPGEGEVGEGGGA